MSALSYGAAGASMALEDLLEQKFREQIQKQQLAEQARQANQRNDVERGTLALGNRRTDEDVRQFDAMEPVRLANVGHTNASTAAMNRQPEEAEKARTFTAGESEKTRTFTTGRDQSQHGYNMREIGAQGANALRVANVRHPDAAAAPPNIDQQNEWLDALKLIDELAADPALSKAVGPLDQYGAGYLTNPRSSGDINRVKSKHDQLVGLLQLAQGGKLKGQGAVSEAERAMLAKAATSLKLGLGEKDYATELRNIQDYYKRKQSGDVRPLESTKVGRFEIIR